MKSFEPNQRIVFFTVHAAFFVSHRLNLALEARNRGLDVLILYGEPASKEMTSFAVEALDTAGLSHKQLTFSSRSLGLRNLLIGYWQLVRELKQFRPTIVHSISSMPILLMLFASLKATRVRRIFAISGLGTIKSTRYFSVFQWLVALLTRSTDTFIFQNTEDRQAFSRGVFRAELISGSGVKKQYVELANKKRNVLFAARLMRSKGVEQFCKVAKRVKHADPTITFTIAGAADYDHSDAISIQELRAYEGFESVEYLGFHDDIDKLYKRASVVLYPSFYAEGLSKTLIEGAMAGCVILTYDRTGCREAVNKGVSGLLLATSATSSDFATTILDLLADSSQVRLFEMMLAANQHAINNFSIDSVTAKHMEIYGK